MDVPNVVPNFDRSALPWAEALVGLETLLLTRAPRRGRTLPESDRSAPEKPERIVHAESPVEAAPVRGPRITAARLLVSIGFHQEEAML
jgi:hypothetical protein